jgi:hypothetical protein
VVRPFSEIRVVDRLGLPAGTLISTIDAGISFRREAHSADVAPPSPLCDRARHERSGVQLA